MSPPDANDIAVRGAGATRWGASGDPTRATATWLALGTGPGGLSWIVVLPGDRRTFVPPPLPDDIAAFRASDARVRFVGGNDPQGYAAIRTDPLAFEPQTWADVVPASPDGYRIGGI